MVARSVSSTSKTYDSPRKRQGPQSSSSQAAMPTTKRSQPTTALPPRPQPTRRPSMNGERSSSSKRVVPPSNSNTVMRQRSGSSVRSKSSEPRVPRTLSNISKKSNSSKRSNGSNTNSVKKGSKSNKGKKLEPEPMFRPRHSSSSQGLSRPDPVARTSSKLSIKSTRSSASTKSKQQQPMTTKVSQKLDSSSKQTFHVRVSLGHLTGVKISQLAKRRNKNAQNQLVVGYACLAKSRKQLALSQPLIPSLDSISLSKPHKLSWTGKPKSNASKTKAKRRLHFNINMEQETDPDMVLENDSKFAAEVVKLIIGLKCGEDEIPLGVANLVINGKDSLQQNLDLALRPIDETSEDIVKTGKKLKNIFGKKKGGASFPNGEYSYSLFPNATLRVKLDVKFSNPGDNLANVWGNIGDDESLGTAASYETHITNSSSYIPPEHQQLLMMNKDGIISRMKASERKNGKTKNDSKVGAYSKNKSVRNGSNVVAGVDKSKAKSLKSHSSKGNSQSTRSKGSLPIKFIMIGEEADGATSASGLTNPGNIGSFWQAVCSPFDLCGDEAVDAVLPPRERNRSSSKHRNSQKGRLQRSTRNGNRLPKLNTKKKSLRDQDVESWASSDSLSEVDDDASYKSESSSSSEDEASDDQSIVSGRFKKTSKQAIPQVLPKGNNNNSEGEVANEGMDLEENLSIISFDTYSDLKGAQVTLLKYALRRGMDMDELLAGVEKKIEKKKAAKREALTEQQRFEAEQRDGHNELAEQASSDRDEEEYFSSSSYEEDEDDRDDNDYQNA